MNTMASVVGMRRRNKITFRSTYPIDSSTKAGQYISVREDNVIGDLSDLRLGYRRYPISVLPRLEVRVTKKWGRLRHFLPMWLSAVS